MAILESCMLGNPHVQFGGRESEKYHKLVATRRLPILHHLHSPGVGGWMYLVAILDWYSRYIVSWELDQTLELPFVLTAVQRALGQAVPLICNSDQGSHFTTPQYCQLLQAANVQISMDGKGRALDTIFTERVWRTVKYEVVYVRTVQPKPVVSDGRMADKDKNLDN
jgi:transposase InsO family protein